jgi:hypothetical protein
MLAVLLLVISLVSGEDSPESQKLVSITPTPSLSARIGTVVAGAQGSSLPGSSPTPVTGTPTAGSTPTATPATADGAVASLPDRTSCGAIQGTDYRSNTERTFYNANCLNLTPVATSASNTIVASANTGSAVADSGRIVIEAAPSPPRDPFLASFDGLVVSLVNESGRLVARTSAPRFIDDSWRTETVAAAKEVEKISSIVSRMVPPNCLISAHGSLRSATFELGVTASLVISAVEQNSSTLLRLADQRVASASSALPAVQARVAAAEC